MMTPIYLFDSLLMFFSRLIIFSFFLFGSRMESESTSSSPQLSAKPSDAEAPKPIASQNNSSAQNTSKTPASTISSWAKTLNFPQPVAPGQQGSTVGDAGTSSFSRFASGLGLSFTSKAFVTNDRAGGNAPTTQSGVFESITKGLIDTSLNAVKAVQVKARHAVSQNKRRYQVDQNVTALLMSQVFLIHMRYEVFSLFI